MSRNGFMQNLPLWQDANREISFFWTFPAWNLCLRVQLAKQILTPPPGHLVPALVFLQSINVNRGTIFFFATVRVNRLISILVVIIWNIATNGASMFTRTCRLFSIVVTSSRLSWRHLDCRDVIKICGQLWSQERPYMKFWASFPKIYRFQQAKPIRKWTLQIGLVCCNGKN